MSKRARAPRHLGSAGREQWRAVLAEYELGDHELTTLQVACESLDRADEARRSIRQEGITFRSGRGEIKANPAVAVERDAKALYLRAMRELALGVNPDDSRPPRIAGRYGASR